MKTETNSKENLAGSSISSAQKITPFLWFNGQAEEAVNFYVGIFKNSRIINMRQFGTMPGSTAKAMTGTFELDGVQFMALDGGPMFNFTEATSFFITCKTQEEVDYLWDKLSGGGQRSRCGWLKDKFGVSWQVIPEALGRLIGGPDPVKAGNAVKAMLKMDKIIIKDLQEAYDKK